MGTINNKKNRSKPSTMFKIPNNLVPAYRTSIDKPDYPITF